MSTYRGAFPAMAVEAFSSPMRIGKHDWRLVTYWHPTMEYRDGRLTEIESQVVGYEWRPAGLAFDADWRRDTDWPRYDADNGQTAGLPASLRKLWDRNTWAHERKTRRPGETKAAGALL